MKSLRDIFVKYISIDILSKLSIVFVHKKMCFAIS